MGVNNVNFSNQEISKVLGQPRALDVKIHKGRQSLGDVSTVTYLHKFVMILGHG